MLLKIKWCHFSLFILFRDFYKDIIILSFSFQNEKIREFMLNNLKFQIYPIPFVSLDTKLKSHNISFYGLNEDSYKTDRFFSKIFYLLFIGVPASFKKWPPLAEFQGQQQDCLLKNISADLMICHFIVSASFFLSSSSVGIHFQNAITVGLEEQRNGRSA